MFQEAALFPWLTVARNVELALQLRKVPRPSGGRRVAELLEMVHLGGFAHQATPRAVGRDAPAGGAGPGPGPGRRHPADGRALRRARRHHPGPAARRARAGVAGHRPHGGLRHPQRPRGGPPRRPGRAAVQPARAGRRRLHRLGQPAPEDRITRGRRAGRGASWTGSGRRWPAMAITETGPGSGSGSGAGGTLDAELSGLDHLGIDVPPRPVPVRPACGRPPGPSWPRPPSRSACGSWWCGATGSRPTSCPGRDRSSVSSGTTSCTAPCSRPWA